MRFKFLLDSWEEEVVVGGGTSMIILFGKEHCPQQHDVYGRKKNCNGDITWSTPLLSHCPTLPIMLASFPSSMGVAKEPCTGSPHLCYTPACSKACMGKFHSIFHYGNWRALPHHTVISQILCQPSFWSNSHMYWVKTSFLIFLLTTDKPCVCLGENWPCHLYTAYAIAT